MLTKIFLVNRKIPLWGPRFQLFIEIICKDSTKDKKRFPLLIEKSNLRVQSWTKVFMDNCENVQPI